MPTALPPASDFVTTGESKGTFKGAMTGLRAFLAGLLGTGGGQAEALAALGAPMNGSLPKTGAYTVVAADRGKVIKCSGTWSLAFTASATLADGFVVEIANTGSGVITLDPYLSETIDAVSTIALAAGKSLIVFCDGTQLMTFGRGGVESLNGVSGAVTTTGLYDIGSFVIGRPFSYAPYAVNSTIAGSSLYATSVSGAIVGAGPAWNGMSSVTLVSVGTWRCVTPCYGDNGGAFGGVGTAGLWVRIS